MNTKTLLLIFCARLTYAGLIEDSQEALQQLHTLMPERLWIQEFSILTDEAAFQKQIDFLKDRSRKKMCDSSYAFSSSEDYLLRSTMTGENIRLFDRYEEFEHSPFWRTPEMMKTLDWLEE